MRSLAAIAEQVWKKKYLDIKTDVNKIFPHVE